MHVSAALQRLQNRRDDGLTRRGPWRDHFKMNLNLGYRHDIDATITDLELWRFVIEHWGYNSRGKWVSFNPLSVSKQLSEYERLERKRESGSAIAYVEKYEHA